MSLSVWDAPNGSYTSVIPPGMKAFRSVVAEVFDYDRTEVIRDRSRCAGKGSEHCECGACDLFTTNAQKGRRLFDWCVSVAVSLGVQSVIFLHREIGFGNPVERHRAKADHMDHVHVGLNRWARVNLTENMVRALLPGEGDWLMALTEEEQQEVLVGVRRLEEIHEALIVRSGTKRQRLDEYVKDRLDSVDARLKDIEAKVS